MNRQLLFEKLEKIGLNIDEVIVYTHLLKEGSKTPLQLSREININRTKIYRIIENLLKKKIVQESNSTLGKRFKVDQPENLKLLIEYEEENLKKRKDYLHDVISELKQLPQKKFSNFEIINYRGVEGLKQMLWNELHYHEVLVFGYDTVNTFVGKTFGDKWRSETVERGMIIKEILNTEIENSDAVQKYNSAENWWKKVYDFRTIPEADLKIRQGTQVFGNIVSYINWSENEYVGVEMTNKYLADMQRQLFWHYWKLAKKGHRPKM